MSIENYTIRGKILDKRGNPASGLIVQAFDKDPISNDDTLGSVMSAKDGTYTIHYSASDFKRPFEFSGADIVLMVYTTKGKLLYQSSVHEDASKDETIDIELDNYTQSEEHTQDSFTIHGRVVNEKGIGVSGFVVEVLALGMLSSSTEQKVLGKSAPSDERGKYSVDTHYARGETMDVIIRVLDDLENELYSINRYGLKSTEETLLTILAKDIKEISEFERVGSAISKYVDAKYDLTSSQNKRIVEDLDYLANKTKWDTRVIAMYIMAQRYANSVIPAEFYYVLFRAGVPSTKEQMYRVNINKALTLFDNAIEKNIIANRVYKKDAFREEWQKNATGAILNSKSQKTISTMDEMLSLSLENQEDRDAFIALYYNEENLDTKWEKIEEKFGAESIERLKLNSKLGYLTLNNIELIKNLKNDFDLNDPIGLVKAGFYEESKWDEYIDDAMLSDLGDDDEISIDEKRTEYKKWMTYQLRSNYPTAVVAEKMKAKKSITDEGYDALYSENFTLGKDSINRLISSKKFTNKATKEQLRSIHRAYQLSPSDNAMEVLLDNKLDSAFTIIENDKETFLQTYAKQFGTEQEAEQVYNKAVNDASLINNLITSHIVEAKNPIPTAIASPSSVKEYPTMEKLFGNLDFCTCGHCESTLSPAAYLVDLLEFLKKNNEKTQTRLFQKRPDIEHIELTCENTHTVLPYIDLVNEILEYWIANKKDSLDDFKGYNISEEMTTEQLLSSPQNIKDSVYTDTLSNAVYPLILPFNRELALKRAYLDQLDTPYYKVIETFRKDDELKTWKGILAEQIGISPKLFEILTDSNAHSVQALLGLDDGEDISNAKEFCRRVNISNRELISLLKSSFIAEKITLIPIYKRNEENCDFEKLKLNLNSEIDLLKLVRFIRLWKHLGWSITQTDKALFAVENFVKPDNLDNLFKEFIIQLALFERVKKRLNLTYIDELFVLLGDDEKLATALRISTNELDSLKALSGIEPFSSFDCLDGENNYKEPNLLKFISYIEKIEYSNFQVSELDFLFRDIDITGKASPTEEEKTTLFNTLQEGLKEIESQEEIENQEEIEDQDLIDKKKKHIKKLKFTYIKRTLSDQFKIDFAMINELLGEDVENSTALLASVLSNFMIKENSQYSTDSAYSSSYVRFVKTLQLILKLELSVEEVKYFVTKEILKDLPSTDFIKIVDYKKLKNNLVIEDDTLVIFLSESSTNTTTLYQFVRWDGDDVKTVIKQIKGEEASEKNLKDIDLFLKVCDIFEVLKLTGLDAETLIAVIKDEKKIEDELKIKYDTDSWLKLSQKVNDKMRTSQRDAMVGYILHQLQKDKATQHIDTADKLFEYFLIDVQMDSCMKTSRIKQAISTVQLFVDRCLYNLEADISPSLINAKQWEWMKRYRVWEANRKIFLHPENWLDPSLRSTKSPFFKEFEGELLQSDINDELATKALLHYLEKVDKVSHLEICGMCREDKETIHVIGKTAGIKQEYYHRRYDGTWSAWEKITLDIEAGPVIPVFWDGRLFLFWTTILQKGQEKTIDATEDSEINNLGGSLELKIEVNLNWSEFYNEKWQEKRTSDFNNPISFDVTGEFNKNDIGLEYFLSDDDKKLGLKVIKNYTCASNYFYFNNTHALPQKKGKAFFSITRSIKGDNGLEVGECNCQYHWHFRHHGQYFSPYKDYNKILNNDFYKITDFAKNGDNLKNAPFFLNDYKHTFFIDVHETTQVLLPNDNNHSIPIDIPKKDIREEIDLIPIPDPLPDHYTDGFTDPSPMEDIIFDFIFDGMLIGKNGKINIDKFNTKGVSHV